MARADCAEEHAARADREARERVREGGELRGVEEVPRGCRRTGRDPERRCAETLHRRRIRSDGQARAKRSTWHRNDRTPVARGPTPRSRADRRPGCRRGPTVVAKTRAGVLPTVSLRSPLFGRPGVRPAQPMITRQFVAATLVAAISMLATSAIAQEIKISRQYGLPYIPLVIMEQQQLLEKHVKRLNGSDVKISWSTVGTTTATIDGLISGQHRLRIGRHHRCAARCGTRRSAARTRSRPSPASRRFPIRWSPTTGTSGRSRTSGRTIASPCPPPRCRCRRSCCRWRRRRRSGPTSGRARRAHGVARRIRTRRSRSCRRRARSTRTSAIRRTASRSCRTPGVHAVLWSNDVTNGPSTTIEVVTAQRVMREHPQWVEAFLAAQEEANAYIAKNPRRKPPRSTSTRRRRSSRADELVGDPHRPERA